MTDFAAHRWSGWPGAWCLDCGAEDPCEIALADGTLETDGEQIWWTDPAAEAAARAQLVCPEPGSRRHDPYHRALRRQQGGGE